MFVVGKNSLNTLYLFLTTTVEIELWIRALYTLIRIGYPVNTKLLILTKMCWDSNYPCEKYANFINTIAINKRYSIKHRIVHNYLF